MNEPRTGQRRSLASFLPPRLIAGLWFGQLLSGVGDRLHTVALMWIATDAVGAQAGWVAAPAAAVRLVLGPLAGVFADRWDRQHAMIAADLLRALAVVTLAVAGYYGPLSLWHLGAVAAALAALDALFAPALQASLPALAPDPPTLLRANAWLDVTRRLAAVLGPGLTGVLLAFIPISQFFAVDAATFVASFLAIAALGRSYAWRPARRRGAAGTRSVLREISGAITLATAHRALSRGIALIGVWNVSSGIAFVVGLPILAREVLGGGPETYGFLVAAYGVGNVASNLVLGNLAVRRRSPVLFSGGVIWGGGMVALGSATSLEVALLCSALAAIGGPMTDLMLLLAIQTEFPPDQIGKIYSLRMTVSRACNGVGLLLAAPVIAIAGASASFQVAGALVLVCSAVWLVRTRLAEAEAGPDRGG